MGIRKFGGIDLFEPEDISQDTSQWNCNCFYYKGRLKFQNYLVEKKPKITEIYERKYFNKDVVDTPGGDVEILETENYRAKGILCFEHEGDDVDEWDHGIPKPTVRVHFDYNNDPDVPKHYHNILDYIFSKKIIDSDFYQAIKSNLKHCDMVNNCEIAVSYSGPYGESGLTILKIANDIPYFFLEIPLFEELNKSDSYSSFKNIKYVNVYIRYEFMEDYLLLDRYDFEVTAKKQNNTPGNRNRYHEPRGNTGLTAKQPFIEYEEIEYTDNNDQEETKNVLWYFSGFFKYQSDDKPSLQWFIPNKIISNYPLIFTELQTYISDDELEDINTDSYDDLKDFWDSEVDRDLAEYISGDFIRTLTTYTRSYGVDEGGSEDKIHSEGNYIEYRKNKPIDDGSFDTWIAKDSSGSDVAYNFDTSLVLKGMGVYDKSGYELDDKVTKPYNYMSCFDTYENSLSTVCLTGSLFNKLDYSDLEETFDQEFIIHKYLISDNKKIFIESFSYSVSGKAHDIIIKDKKIDEFFKASYLDDPENYMFEIWLSDNEVFKLLQRFSLRGLSDFVSGITVADVSLTRAYDINDFNYDYNINESYKYYTNGEYTNGDSTVNKGDFIDTVSISDETNSSSWASERNQDKVSNCRRHQHAIVICKTGTVKKWIHYPHHIGYDKFYLNSFANAVDVFFNEDSDSFEIYFGFSSAVVDKQNLWIDTVDSIEETIKSIDYNYDELLEIIDNGVAIECPENYDEMFQKEKVSKHELYMDRLFKSIDDENEKSLLYYSEQSYPEAFSPSSVFKFNLPILHLENFREKLYIFTKEEIKVLSGSNNLTFILDRFYTDGCYEWTVVQHEDVLYFSNTKGIYAIQEGYPVSISDNIQKLFDEEQIVPDYAEVLTGPTGDFYVLHLNEKVSPLKMMTISFEELQMILGGGEYILNGVDWKSTKTSEEDLLAVENRFSINKIAVSLRDGSIWFGTDVENADKKEFLWKSSEMVQESFFVMKSFKRVSLDFYGRINSVFSRNRQDPMTYVMLPQTSSAESLGERTKPTNKSSKNDPSDWTVQGERSHSNSILFLSENPNSILFKWEITENGYSIGDNETENEN